MQRLLVRSKAKGTIRGYTSSINSWFKYAAEKDLLTNPATTFGVTRYITMLADSNVISYWKRTMFNSPLPEARMINITMVP